MNGLVRREEGPSQAVDMGAQPALRAAPRTHQSVQLGLRTSRAVFQYGHVGQPRGPIMSDRTDDAFEQVNVPELGLGKAGATFQSS